MSRKRRYKKLNLGRCWWAGSKQRIGGRPPDPALRRGGRRRSGAPLTVDSFQPIDSLIAQETSNAQTSPKTPPVQGQ
jgi:hypothetical protein